MPGHYTSSFVSRGRGLAEVIDQRISAPQSGFGECRREHCPTSAKPGTVAPKNTPARGHTVNTKTPADPSIAFLRAPKGRGDGVVESPATKNKSAVPCGFVLPTAPDRRGRLEHASTQAQTVLLVVSIPRPPP